MGRRNFHHRQIYRVSGGDNLGGLVVGGVLWNIYWRNHVMVQNREALNWFPQVTRTVAESRLVKMFFPSLLTRWAVNKSTNCWFVDSGQLYVDPKGLMSSRSSASTDAEDRKFGRFFGMGPADTKSFMVCTMVLRNSSSEKKLPRCDLWSCPNRPGQSSWKFCLVRWVFHRSIDRDEDP